MFDGTRISLLGDKVEDSNKAVDANVDEDEDAVEIDNCDGDDGDSDDNGDSGFNISDEL